MGKVYKIVRFWRDSGTRRTVKWNLTLEEARRHCNDPETSSSTCKGYKARRRTYRGGPWFDGYAEQ
jgi:hypothetical protein